MLKKIKEKLKKARELNKKAYDLAKDGLKLRVKQYRSDPLLFALVGLDVILIMLLIFAIFFLFDPNKEFQLDSPIPPIPWEFKFIIFAFTVFLVWKLYSYTEWYRKKINKK